MINVQETSSAEIDEKKATEYLKSQIEKLSFRYTKTFLPPSADSEDYVTIPVVFEEPESTLPVSSCKIKVMFRVSSIRPEAISFSIENEAVLYPLFDSINLTYFQSILDRVSNDKKKAKKNLHLHSEFESTRIISMDGDRLKLFTIEEEEDIFSNNLGRYFNFNNYEFKSLNYEVVSKLISTLWKTLSNSESSLSFERFRLLFDYGQLQFSQNNLEKLWRYSDVNKKGSIDYNEFSLFCTNLLLCLRAYHISFYKQEKNQFVEEKVKKNFEIMNLHFKEYDTDANEEISFENLKKSLLKESELFTRKEIEIILNIVNPEKNFEYWKFDHILRILYSDHFNYNFLINEDKIFKFLIKIFEKQDTKKTKRLHYKKMKYAFLIQDKLVLNKTQILTILNFFDINKNPEIDYFKATLLIRDIVAHLNTSEFIEILEKFNQPDLINFIPFEDTFDSHSKNIIGLFTQHDKDYDHLLNFEEFSHCLLHISSFISEAEIKDIFKYTDINKDEFVSFSEFKMSFPNIMNMLRVKTVLIEIRNIIE